mgnify:CR=1 FL=1
MADDAIFQDAIETLRAGDKAKARDMITGLLKTDQNNVTYWIWLSAAMETPKERAYCLQTALKLDPENTTAKRGLILLGAMPPDENVRPFPVNRPRAWEEKLLLAHEQPKPTGWERVRTSPAFRLGGIAVIAAVVISAVYFGFIVPATQQAAPPTRTPGPSPTWTFTPTALNSTGVPGVVSTPYPLSELLAAPQVHRHILVVEPLEVERDAHAVGRGAAEIIV